MGKRREREEREGKEGGRRKGWERDEREGRTGRRVGWERGIRKQEERKLNETKERSTKFLKVHPKGMDPFWSTPFTPHTLNSQG